MNKRIIISFLIIFCSIGVFLGVREFLSYKDVSIVLKQPAIVIDIYSSDEKKLSSVSDDTTIRLKSGSYYYVPVGDRYSTKKVEFIIATNETLEVNPSFSDEYLSTLLTKEQGSAQQVLSSEYPSLISGYIIGDEHLAHQGEWYSAKLIQRVSGGNQPDIYRVVLKKENTAWKVSVSPRLIISIAQFPQVPDYVIHQVNQAVSNEAYSLLYP